MPNEKPSWWVTPRSESPAELAKNAVGLSGAEAKERLVRYGPNLFHERKEKTLLLEYLTRLKNPMNIFLVASAVSAFTGEITNGHIIARIVLLSVALDFIQEHRDGMPCDIVGLSFVKKSGQKSKSIQYT